MAYLRKDELKPKPGGRRAEEIPSCLKNGGLQSLKE
jgi:hypothetical protein